MAKTDSNVNRIQARFDEIDREQDLHGAKFWRTLSREEGKQSFFFEFQEKEPQYFLTAGEHTGSSQGIYQALCDTLRARRSDALTKAIEASRRILDLHENWDGEGGQAYAYETWRRSVDFLRQSQTWLLRYFGLELDIPSIDPGPEGGIDLHWKKANCELLMHVPRDTGADLQFYGDDSGRNAVKGKMRSDSPTVGLLLLWLAGSR